MTNHALDARLQQQGIQIIAPTSATAANRARETAVNRAAIADRKSSVCLLAA
jgi:hypothetical protein